MKKKERKKALRLLLRQLAPLIVSVMSCNCPSDNIPIVIQEACCDCEKCKCLHCNCRTMGKVFTVTTLKLINCKRSVHLVSNLLISRIKSLKNIISQRGQDNVLFLLFSAPFSSDSVLSILAEKGFEAIVLPSDSNDLVNDQGDILVDQGDILKTVILVSGMSCTSCVAGIVNCLKGADGVVPDSVSVSLIPSKVELSHFKYTSPQQIANIIEDMGYTICGIESILLNATNYPQEKIADFMIGGMSCSSCVASIENVLKQDGMGVLEVNVSLLTHRAKVVYNPQIIGVRDIKNQIEDMGFTASIVMENDFDHIVQNIDQREMKDLYYQWLWSLLFVIPTFFISMIIMMVLPDGNVLKMWFMQDIVSGLTISDLLLFILATPVQFGLGWRFFDGAFRSLVFAKTANVRYLLNIRWMYWWLSVQG